MKHDTARELLAVHAIGVLGLSDAMEVDRHIAVCRQCSQEADIYGFGAAALDAIAGTDPDALHTAEPVPPAPPGTLDRIAEAVFAQLGGYAPAWPGGAGTAAGTVPVQPGTWGVHAGDGQSGEAPGQDLAGRDDGGIFADPAGNGAIAATPGGWSPAPTGWAGPADDAHEDVGEAAWAEAGLRGLAPPDGPVQPPDPLSPPTGGRDEGQDDAGDAWAELAGQETPTATALLEEAASLRTVLSRLKANTAAPVAPPAADPSAAVRETPAPVRPEADPVATGAVTPRVEERAGPGATDDNGAVLAEGAGEARARPGRRGLGGLFRRAPDLPEEGGWDDLFAEPAPPPAALSAPAVTAAGPTRQAWELRTGRAGGTPGDDETAADSWAELATADQPPRAELLYEPLAGEAVNFVPASVTEEREPDAGEPSSARAGVVAEAMPPPPVAADEAGETFERIADRASLEEIDDDWAALLRGEPEEEEQQQPAALAEVAAPADALEADGLTGPAFAEAVEAAEDAVHVDGPDAVEAASTWAGVAVEAMPSPPTATDEAGETLERIADRASLEDIDDDWAALLRGEPEEERPPFAAFAEVAAPADALEADGLTGPALAEAVDNGRVEATLAAIDNATGSEETQDAGHIDGADAVEAAPELPGFSAPVEAEEPPVAPEGPPEGEPAAIASSVTGVPEAVAEAPGAEEPEAPPDSPEVRPSRTSRFGFLRRRGRSVTPAAPEVDAGPGEPLGRPAAADTIEALSTIPEHQKGVADDWSEAFAGTGVAETVPAVEEAPAEVADVEGSDVVADDWSELLAGTGVAETAPAVEEAPSEVADAEGSKVVADNWSELLAGTDVAEAALAVEEAPAATPDAEQQEVVAADLAETVPAVEEAPAEAADVEGSDVVADNWSELLAGTEVADALDAFASTAAAAPPPAGIETERPRRSRRFGWLRRAIPGGEEIEEDLDEAPAPPLSAPDAIETTTAQAVEPDTLAHVDARGAAPEAIEPEPAIRDASDEDVPAVAASVVTGEAATLPEQGITLVEEAVATVLEGDSPLVAEAGGEATPGAEEAGEPPSERRGFRWLRRRTRAEPEAVEPPDEWEAFSEEMAALAAPEETQASQPVAAEAAPVENTPVEVTPESAGTPLETAAAQTAETAAAGAGLEEAAPDDEEDETQPVAPAEAAAEAGPAALADSSGIEADGAMPEGAETGEKDPGEAPGSAVGHAAPSRKRLRGMMRRRGGPRGEGLAAEPEASPIEPGDVQQEDGGAPPTEAVTAPETAEETLEPDPAYLMEELDELVAPGDDPGRSRRRRSTPRRRRPGERARPGGDRHGDDDVAEAAISPWVELSLAPARPPSAPVEGAFATPYIPGPVDWGLERYDDDEPAREHGEAAPEGSSWKFWTVMFGVSTVLLLGLLIAGIVLLVNLHEQSAKLEVAAGAGAVPLVFTSTVDPDRYSGEGYLEKERGRALLALKGVVGAPEGAQFVVWADNGMGTVTPVSWTSGRSSTSTRYFTINRVPADTARMYITIEVFEGRPEPPAKGEILLEAPVP